MKKLTKVAVAAAMLGLAGTAAAHTAKFTATLNGATEQPPNASPGTGSGTVTVDLDTLIMTVDVTFSGLLGNVTASHIHCCTAVADAGNVGVATPTPSFPGFPSGGTAGSYLHDFDLSLASSYNAAFVNAQPDKLVSTAMNALLAGMGGGNAYLNIHTNLFPGGEIRGFLHAAPVPLPAAVFALSPALVALGLMRRRQAA